MKLHGYWRSSTSYRVRIGLELKGLDYEHAPVNLLKGEHRGEAYRALNPHGTVPMLETAEGHITQSLAILDWLEATHPEPSFLPERDAMLCRELYYAVATELHAPLNPSVLKRLFGDDQAAKEDFYRFVIHRTLAPVEARLAAHEWTSETLPFGQPTLFEIVLVPQLYNARRWTVELADFPQLTAIGDYCDTLPAFRAARPEAQLDAQPGAT